MTPLLSSLHQGKLRREIEGLASWQNREAMYAVAHLWARRATHRFPVSDPVCQRAIAAQTNGLLTDAGRTKDLADETWLAARDGDISATIRAARLACAASLESDIANVLHRVAVHAADAAQRSFFPGSALMNPILAEELRLQGLELEALLEKCRAPYVYPPAPTRKAPEDDAHPRAS